MSTVTMARPGISRDFASDPHLDSRVKDFLKELNKGTPLETMSPVNARQAVVDAQASAKVDLTGIDISEKTITADGFTIHLHIVRPEGEQGILPVFMFIHGGGWVLGDFPTHKRMVRDLVVSSGAVAVFVNYTRTPDAVYPQAINEIYAATKWVAENGAVINVDG
ncbi:MAG TPA: alpha/beta hydrolase fold domain-containing protein, partial [Flavisolibacter sp.]